MKISNELFNFDEDIYVCHLYIPPNNSKIFTTSEIDLFEQLELGIVKYNNLGKVFVSGDLNSRTSDSLDYFEHDKYLDQSLFILNTCSIPIRTNKDRIIDHYGIRLLDMCQATGLLIANGRLFCDQGKGKFTFCAHNGQSTVDYLLLNYSDITALSNFDILDFLKTSIQTMPRSCSVFTQNCIKK